MATPHATVIAGDWLIAMRDDPPAALRGGGVRVATGGRIDAVGAVDDILQPGDSLTVLPGTVLTPGLVNAHAHLDMSYWQGRRDRLASRPLHEWVVEIMAERRAQPADAVARAAAEAASASLSLGVTTVVDVTPVRFVWQEVFDAIAATPLRRIALAEVLGFNDRAEESWSLFLSLVPRTSSRAPSFGLSPHAPYSTAESLYARCLQAAHDRQLPLMTHLSETPEEIEFCRAGGGPWRDLLEQRHGPIADLAIAGCSPVEYAGRLGLLDYPRTLLAHVNYLTPGDLERLAAGCATVAYCPRTADFFEHHSHPWRRLREAGVNVAVGTDSLASSPDLSILGELQFLRRRHPDIKPGELFALATRNAQQAGAGVLERGAWADLAAWPLNRGDDADALLADVLENADRPAAVFVAGDRVV